MFLPTHCIKMSNCLKFSTSSISLFKKQTRTKAAWSKKTFFLDWTTVYSESSDDLFNLPCADIIPVQTIVVTQS